MQLHQDTAKKYGVDAHDPRANIMGGAAVLAHLMDKYNGDIRRVLRTYNATCTAAYEREVIRAYNQAQHFELSALLQISPKEIRLAIQTPRPPDPPGVIGRERFALAGGDGDT